MNIATKPERGYIQVYTGDSKGKTTASLGLALRALGHDWKILLTQFMKAEEMWPYGEIKSLVKFASQIQINQYGLSRVGIITEDDIKHLKQGWEESRTAILSGNYDLIILDELNHLTYNGIVKVDEVLNVLRNKPEHLEIVITGRNADPAIVDFADLVTEMTCKKHYFNEGVMAREGVEY